MYSNENFKTKKALKEAVKAWKAFEEGVTSEPAMPVRCYQPGPFGPNVADGSHCCEGPHFPALHKWYATVIVKDGKITSVK